jgi:hypothetical protein
MGMPPIIYRKVTLGGAVATPSKLSYIILA